MTDVGQRVVRDLRDLLFSHILGQSAAFFSEQTSGRLMSRITNDVSQVQQAVSETLGDLARESLSLVGFGVLLFYYDPRLAIVCLTSAPLVVYPLVRLGQRVRRSTRRRTRSWLSGWRTRNASGNSNHDEHPQVHSHECLREPANPLWQLVMRGLVNGRRCGAPHILRRRALTRLRRHDRARINAPVHCHAARSSSGFRL